MLVIALVVYIMNQETQIAEVKVIVTIIAAIIILLKGKVVSPINALTIKRR